MAEPSYHLFLFGKHISIAWEVPSKSGRTWTWEVRTKDGDGGRGELLGHVRWFGRWRRYALFPEPGTVFEQDCLREVAAFIEDATKRHQRMRAVRRMKV